jgi:hypothetical protein
MKWGNGKVKGLGFLPFADFVMKMSFLSLQCAKCKHIFDFSNVKLFAISKWLLIYFLLPNLETIYLNPLN